jgi:hypothetical protein
VWWRREKHIGLSWGNLKVKPPVGRLRQRLEDSSEMDFRRNRMGEVD